MAAGAFLLAVWAVVAAVVAGVAAQERPVIKPSLECSCRSSSPSDSRFDLNCHNVLSRKPSRRPGGENGMQNENTILSCAQAPRSSAEDSGDAQWWFADVPGHGVYRLSKRFLTWKDAAAACDATREQLVALDGGEAEMKAMLRAFADEANDRKELLWVGIRRWEKDGFYTVRGQKMAALPWRPDHPISPTPKGQECVTLGIEGKLHGPHGCNGKRRFFCRYY